MRVEKWHGAGNDFVVADGQGTRAPADWAAWTRAACDRRRGVGADGLLVLEPDPDLDFRMHYRNADGGVAEMCGNGGRVLAAFAAERGRGQGGRVRFRSAWGVHVAQVERRGPALYHVALSLPDVPAAAPLEVPTPWGPARALRVTCGVPHLVLRVGEGPAPALEAVDVAGWGPALRRLPELGPAGANVDFVAVGADGTLHLRTYERGVEAETLACGTGATATAVAASRLGWGGPPWRVRARSGDRLEVAFVPVGDLCTGVELRGPAARVFATEFEPARD
jgi:diaminopimelate epimerase